MKKKHLANEGGAKGGACIRPGGCDFLAIHSRGRSRAERLREGDLVFSSLLSLHFDFQLPTIVVNVFPELGRGWWELLYVTSTELQSAMPQ